MMQFLIEGLLLITLGGALGFGVSIAIMKIVAHSGLTEYIGVPNIDVFGVTLTLVILGLTGLLSGIFPARRASNMQPVHAIKLF